MANINKIELHPAYCWSCPICEAINFGALEQPVNIEQALKEAEKEFGAEIEGEELFINPKTVRCGACLALYNTVYNDHDIHEFDIDGEEEKENHS